MTERQKAQFYASSAWHRARQRALQRDRYICQDCLARAKALRRAGVKTSMDIRAATVVPTPSSLSMRRPYSGPNCSISR